MSIGGADGNLLRLRMGDPRSLAPAAILDAPDEGERNADDDEDDQDEPRRSR